MAAPGDGRVLAVPTIGVSIAVPEPWGAQLQTYRESLGDESAAGIPTHITLLPPTDVDSSLLDDIADHLACAASAHRPFQMRLRGTGTFRPVSPVVFVTVAQGIGGCEQLAAAVCTGPLAIDLHFPYHPHVTVAHQMGEYVLDRAFEELASFDCSFEVVEFHLYLHHDTQGWQPTRTFGLG